MTSFFQRLFGGQISPEQQQAVVAYLTEEWKLGALRELEAARCRDASIELIDSGTPGSASSSAAHKQLTLATERMLQRIIELQRRHSELRGVPAEARACHHRWGAAYHALVERVSSEVATHSGLERAAEAGRYAAPDFGGAIRVHTAEETARRRADKEEEKLLKRLEMRDEDKQRLKKEAEATAIAEEAT